MSLFELMQGDNMLSFYFFIEFIRLFLLFILVFGYKKQKNFQYFFILIFMIFLIIDILSFTALIEYQAVIFRIAPIVFICSAIVLMMYVLNTYKILLKLIMIQIIFNFVDLLLLNIAVNAFAYRDSVIGGSIFALPVLLIPSTVVLGIISLVLYKKNFVIHIEDMKWWTVILIILGAYGFGYTVLLLQMEGFSTGYWFSNIINIIAFFGSILFLFIIIVFFYKHHSLQEAKRLIALHESKMLSQQLYLKALTLQEEETRKFRHDFSRHLQNIYALYKDKQYRLMEQYFDDLNQTIEILNKYDGIDTGNRSVNLFINGFHIQYPEIEIEWEGLLFEEERFKIKDQTSLYSNLFSNAFEASSLCDVKFVHVNVKHNKDSLYIQVKNTAITSPIIVGNNLISSKKEINNHGFGTKIIRDVVSAYDGDVTYNYHEGVFVTEVILQFDTQHI